MTTATDPRVTKAIALVEEASRLLFEAGEMYPAQCLDNFLTNDAPGV